MFCANIQPCPCMCCSQTDKGAACVIKCQTPHEKEALACTLKWFSRPITGSACHACLGGYSCQCAVNTWACHTNGWLNVQRSLRAQCTRGALTSPEEVSHQQEFSSKEGTAWPEHTTKFKHRSVVEGNHPLLCAVNTEILIGTNSRFMF